ALAHTFLPPAAHDAFRTAYGALDADTWRIARFRALTTAIVILLYAHEVGDEAVETEARQWLEHLS
ncbi:MAG: DNA repair protein RecN, partial [Phycisphaerales bacterium]|nr:DNA repair protein RecN [Phycisphaerales bacterium]